VRDQRIAAPAFLSKVFLDGGVFGVEVDQGADIVARLDTLDEVADAFNRWHLSFSASAERWAATMTGRHRPEGPDR
jgi:hypothetical protein